MTDAVTPLVFSTVSDEEIRARAAGDASARSSTSSARTWTRSSACCTSTRPTTPEPCTASATPGRYDARMKAVEYAMEHDDGASLRNLEQADLILVAPSRCGKTPTSMYLALQHGLKVANYPLVEEDFESADLPRPSAPHRRTGASGCSRPRPGSARCAASGDRGRATPRLAQCSYELRRAEALYRAHRIPVDQLRGDVRRGDGRRHHAEPTSARPRLTGPDRGGTP